MVVIDKARIIEAIQQTDDERILFAIKRLLQIEDEEITAWQKLELDRRCDRLNKGEEEVYEWHDIKEEIQKLD